MLHLQFYPFETHIIGLRVLIWKLTSFPPTFNFFSNLSSDWINFRQPCEQNYLGVQRQNSWPSERVIIRTHARGIIIFVVGSVSGCSERLLFKSIAPHILWLLLLHSWKLFISFPVRNTYWFSIVGVDARDCRCRNVDKSTYAWDSSTSFCKVCKIKRDQLPPF